MCGISADGAVGASGSTETISLTAKIGEDIILKTGIPELHGDSEILWTHGPNKDVIIHYENGKLLWIQKGSDKSEKFELDAKTGSLIIRSLNVSDGGFYHGHIINGNDSNCNFNLTFVKSDPIPTIAGPTQTTTAHGPADGGTQWNHIAVGASFGILGLICFVLLIWALSQKKIKGNRQGDNGVV
ncbi:hypothetical protein Q5P01_026025 [Channa striata]|uniref:Uncharacterized protein n=1 Tax=Channa striata TaxID=64152 RepID=A0AA88IJE9_CHASR|nr:hypothetical protein Q5P01_026025 [Channa striata]